jgi:hypothetical protein
MLDGGVGGSGVISNSLQKSQAMHSAYGEHEWLFINHEAENVIFYDIYSFHAGGGPFV